MESREILEVSLTDQSFPSRRQRERNNPSEHDYHHHYCGNYLFLEM
jgi:hypothetical protein